MRSIKQPGEPIAERIQWVEGRGRAFTLTLEAGLPLLEAARRGFAAQGFSGGTLNMRGGALGPFGYVMPALSKTGENAAFYSDTFRPAGVTRLKLATMTFGTRDGAPFFHCHGLWREADGRISGGHMLPEETFIAETFEVEAFGIDGAVFKAEPDPETRFKLFGPVQDRARGADTSSRAFASRFCRRIWRTTTTIMTAMIRTTSAAVLLSNQVCERQSARAAAWVLLAIAISGKRLTCEAEPTRGTLSIGLNTEVVVYRPPFCSAACSNS